MPSIASRIVPARFEESTFDSYEPQNASQERAKLVADLIARSMYRSAVFVGPPGVGKTHLAAAAVNAMVAIERDAYRRATADISPEDRWPRIPVVPMWVNVADLIVSLRAEMDTPPDDRAATTAVRELRRHPTLVVLDDLGREKVTDWTGEMVYALVNTRYEDRLPTLVTSNLTPAELAASPYWPAISRLAEDGELVKIQGTDRRLA